MSGSRSKNRQRESSRAATLIPGEPHVARVEGMAQASMALGAMGTGFGMGGQGYGLADWSAARGYIYFPQLDTKREVTPYTRTTGLAKARFLDANVGLVGRLLDGMSRLAMGTGIMPNPTTSDKEWNAAMRKRIRAVLGSAQTYDLAGRHDFYSVQAPAMKAAYRDGDLGKCYVRDENGNLRVAFYEGHQIGGEPKGYLAPGPGSGLPQVLDGVRVDRANRRLSFVIQEGDQRGETVEIPAADMCLLLNEKFGPPRGVTILKHAINKLVDRAELEAMVSHGLKAAQRFGFAITRSSDAVAKPPSWESRGPGGVNPARRETITKADGTTARVKVEDVMSPTGGEIPDLPPGYDIKTILDTRPHPNTIEFFDYIARDTVLGCDFPHELLYNIWKLGGANTRYVMADGQSVIEREQQRYIDLMGARDYIAFGAEEIRMGRVPKCRDPEWWAHEFIPPARITVDFTRDGKLYLEQIKSGALTYRRYFGWQGLGIEQLDEWLDEVKHVSDAAGQRWQDESGKPDPKMQQFILQALYQRVGLASSLDSAPTAAEIAAAQADNAPAP